MDQEYLAQLKKRQESIASFLKEANNSLKETFETYKFYIGKVLLTPSIIFAFAQIGVNFLEMELYSFIVTCLYIVSFE